MQNEPAAENFPFKGTEATNLLKAALDTIVDERGLSNRAVARQLGYKATVVISHMATGRVPIPLERAVEIASVVGLDPRQFFLAVLEQRYPGSTQVLSLGSAEPLSDRFAVELELLAGSPLEQLDEEHRAVMREVVTDVSPRRRWLSLAELPFMMRLRELRPAMTNQGLAPGEAQVMLGALDGR